jgi:DNA polymerase IV
MDSSPASAAAPEGAHTAPFHSATNRMAPVRREQRAAVEAQGSTPTTGHVESAGGVATGSGIAGIAAASGAARRGDHGSVPRESPPGTPPRPREGVRTILHVDIDAFFAAIEQQRDPRLQGKPVIVGAGVIASCSYEARAFGLKAGMPLSEARRICPQAVILDGHAQVYRCFAEEIFAHCRRVAPEVETYLDEAYCELTGTERLHGDLAAMARGLKRDILAATGLTVTCGLGPNRMLAKLVGKTVKPDGLACITADAADAFLVDRPIDQLAGVGHAHAKTLRSMNLKTIGDLRALPVDVLTALFGVHGRLLHERCRGRDTAPVTEREIPLSISRETSFHRDTADRGEIEGMLEYLVGRACRTSRELEIRPRTIGVHLRYSDGEGAERERSLSQASDTDPVVLELALDLLRRLFTRRVALHAAGVRMSNFARAGGEQGSLFDEREAGRRAQLYKAFDHVRGEFGHGVLVSGRALRLKHTVAEDRHGFVLRTSSLTK